MRLPLPTRLTMRPCARRWSDRWVAGQRLGQRAILIGVGEQAIADNIHREIAAIIPVPAMGGSATARGCLSVSRSVAGRLSVTQSGTQRGIDP